MERDAHLLSAIASGDEVAFRQLFDLYRDKVYNYMLHVTKSPAIAEEIVLDVFLKLWIGRELIQEIRDMDAFLHKVAYNKAIDFFRMAAKEKNLQKAIEQKMQDSKEKEADYKLIQSEYQQIINKAIEQLSPQRRLIFTLSRMDGLTHDEIAQQLQLSRNTVRNTIADTLKSIRDFLQGAGIYSNLLILLLLKL
jgi:RNA polymerase sigma-70 factor (ECF subfamily)